MGFDGSLASDIFFHKSQKKKEGFLRRFNI